MAELTHIFDHLPALQSLSADPSLLQGKFVSLAKPSASRFSSKNFVTEKTRTVKRGFRENFGNAERDERKRLCV